jgi:hypothetical protein
VPTVALAKPVVVMETAAVPVAAITVTVIVLSCEVSFAAAGWTVMVAVPAVTPVMVITPLESTVAVAMPAFEETAVIALVEKFPLMVVVTVVDCPAVKLMDCEETVKTTPLEELLPEEAAALTFKVIFCVTVWPPETTLATTVEVPAAVGVPEIIKVDELKVSPAGKPVTVQTADELKLLAEIRWP